MAHPAAPAATCPRLARVSPRVLLTGLLVVVSSHSCTLASAFVTRVGNQLFDEAGSVFRWGGTNNWYIANSDAYLVDDVLQRAAANNFSVVRMWPFLDAVNCSTGTGADGWLLAQPNNTTALQRVDYVVYKARQLGLRLIMTLVNNWADCGGMDVYTSWRVQQDDPTFTPYHDSFYTDPTIRGWYREWVEQITGRLNTYTGLTYKDDPTILAWELGNELRCSNDGPYPASPGCVQQGSASSSSPHITPWVQEMSSYIKSVDSNHLVSVGDEGWWCNGTAQCQRDWPSGDGTGQWWCNCAEGTDTLAFAAAPDVDIATVHLYPHETGQEYSSTWWAEVIANHSYQVRTVLGKALAVEEFGWGTNLTNATSPQSSHYAAWTQYAQEQGVNGWNFWQLVGRLDNSSAGYACDPSYPFWFTCSDTFKVWCNSSAAGDPPLPPGWDYDSCAVLAEAAGNMRGGG